MGLFDRFFRGRTPHAEAERAPMPEWFAPELGALQDKGLFFARVKLDDPRLRDLWRNFTARWSEERPDPSLLTARLATLDEKRVWSVGALLPSRDREDFAVWLEALADISDWQFAPTEVEERWPDDETVEVEFTNGERRGSLRAIASDPTNVLAALIGAAQIEDGRFQRLHAGDDRTHVILLRSFEKREAELLGLQISSL